MTIDPKDAPNYRSPANVAMAPSWTLLRDVLGGTRRMRECATTYLPKMEVETPNDYAARVARTPFYNATDRTLEGLVGLAFRSPPTLSSHAAPVLQDHAEDIDGEGNHVEVFAKRSFDAAVGLGFGGILVDYAAVANPGQLTKADEQAGNLRPYWVHVTADQILSVRTTRAGAATVLAQVVIEEKVSEPTGSFGEELVCQYRVLTREGRGVIRWEVWRESTTTKGEWSVTGGYFRNQPEIPLALYYTGRKLGTCLSQVPLENLAWANVAHFQVASDHRNSLHIAGVPILVRYGIRTGDSNVVAASMAWDLPTDARVEWVEHKGAALGESRTELRDIEQQMANLGLSMLAAQPRAVETAEAKRIDEAAQNSQLATAARALQDALEQAWVFHAAYLGVPAPEVDYDTDFERMTLNAQDITAYSALVSAGQLSVETMWERLKLGGALPDDFDPEAEAAKIEDNTLPPDPPANLVGTIVQGTAVPPTATPMPPAPVTTAATAAAA